MGTIDISRRDFLRGQRNSTGQRALPPGTTLDGLKSCTGCGRCQDVCPTQIISIASARPFIDFAIGECTFCGECARACPEPVFSDLPQSRFAHAVGINDRCLARNGVECQFCRDACPEQAIHFRPRIGGPFLPEVNQTACTGCGACIGVCPVRAIDLVQRAEEVVTNA